MEPGIERTIVLAVGQPGGLDRRRHRHRRRRQGADRVAVARRRAQRARRLRRRADQRRAGGRGDGVRHPGDGRRVRPRRARREARPARQARARCSSTGDSLVAAAGRAARAAPVLRRRAHGARAASRHRHLQERPASTGARCRPRRSRRSRPTRSSSSSAPTRASRSRRAGGKSVDCCGPAWAAQYATRARKMMQTYRQDSAARVYWLTLPMPRGPARQKIARTVNAAIFAAAQPFRAQVRVLDMSALFTPGGKYRASMPVEGPRHDRPRARRHPPQRGRRGARRRPRHRAHEGGLRLAVERPATLTVTRARYAAGDVAAHGRSENARPMANADVISAVSETLEARLTAGLEHARPARARSRRLHDLVTPVTSDPPHGHAVSLRDRRGPERPQPRAVAARRQRRGAAAASAARPAACTTWSPPGAATATPSSGCSAASCRSSTTTRPRRARSCPACSPGSPEQLHVSLAPVELEDRARVWSAIGQTYRLSVNYEVRVVDIDAESETAAAPVRERRIDDGAVA